MGVFQLTTTSIPKWGKGKRQKNGYDENKKTPRQKKEYTLSGEDKTQKRNRDSYKKIVRQLPRTCAAVVAQFFHTNN